MGSAASKPAKSAVGAASRQYPKKAAPPPRTPAPASKGRKAKAPQAPSAPTPQSRAPASAPQGPTYHSKEQPSGTKSSAIELDGRDPDFAASLRSIGPVDPSRNYINHRSIQTVFPTDSNPALLVASARKRIEKAAQEENAQIGLGAGRQYLDSFTITQALSMRDQQRLPVSEIEKSLRLKKGTLDKLGQRGLYSRAV
ncbi:hypothetical protein N7495_006830 [Penicillium taxi]|uniref:uncharacterized protein n=1 Tax=Penicillium taxi TaxID=168475 RepID=UPI002544D769|nr:uncharacterized protein N7495_006830 [Penicillium taxi]KAJ5895139.1 hypothetical protein N7495_006830 [Penicillium taxi]